MHIHHDHLDMAKSRVSTDHAVSPFQIRPLNSTIPRYLRKERSEKLHFCNCTLNSQQVIIIILYFHNESLHNRNKFRRTSLQCFKHDSVTL